jgi:hypothetical protein
MDDPPKRCCTWRNRPKAIWIFFLFLSEISRSDKFFLVQRKIILDFAVGAKYKRKDSSQRPAGQFRETGARVEAVFNITWRFP